MQKKSVSFPNICVDVNLICVRDVSKIQFSNIRAINIMPGLNTAELN